MSLSHLSLSLSFSLELKGRFVGHTSHTVKEAVADAMGGCLFVDEAYSLVDRGGDRFSGEAVRMLLTELENNRGQVLVIMAGYADKMSDLMGADPGMPRRFVKTLNLEVRRRGWRRRNEEDVCVVSFRLIDISIHPVSTTY